MKTTAVNGRAITSKTGLTAADDWRIRWGIPLTGSVYCNAQVTGEDGQRFEYEVYFELSRASRKGVLNLYVQSAYVRDAQHKEAQPKRKPIGFLILLFNIQNNKPIKTPT